MRAMIRLISIVAILTVGFAAYIEFTKIQRPAQSASSPDGNQDERSAAEVNYSLRAVDNTWPAIESDQAIDAGNLSRNNYYLVFDGSGSMGDHECAGGKSKIGVAKTAVVEFISKIPGDANLGLLVFDNTGTRERVALGQGSKNRAIDEIRRVRTGGGTPLDSAIRLAYNALTKQARSQLGYGEYHLVVVTDGEASDGQNPKRIVQSVTANSPVVLHTIGFCISGNHSLNQAGVTLYRSANNPMELARGLDSVLAEASDFSVDSFTGEAQ